jgi:hypothetical protein
MLAWESPPTVRCCHVYYEWGLGEQQHWLGVATGSRFCLHAVQVPAGALAVTFKVVPISESRGSQQPWGQAASVTVALGGGQSTV